jgi:hypothetical protein
MAVAVAASLGQSRPAANPPATAPAAAPEAPPAAVLPRAAAAASDPPPAPPARPTLWELHEKARPVIYALDACSVLALAIIFERLFSLRRSA